MTTLLLVVLVVTGGALRAYKLNVSYWDDEISTRSDSIGPLGHSQNFYGKPAFYGLVHFALKLGDHESNLRLPGFLAGVAAIPVVFCLGAALCGRNAGLIAAFLLSFSVFNIMMSHNGRYYSLVVLAAASSLLILCHGSRGSRKALWLLWFIVPAMGLLVHPFFAFFLASASAGYFVWLLFRKGGATWGKRILPVVGFSLITCFAFAPFAYYSAPNFLKSVYSKTDESNETAGEQILISQEKKSQAKPKVTKRLKYGRTFDLAPESYLNYVKKQFDGLIPGGGLGILLLGIMGLARLVGRSPMFTLVSLCVLLLPPLYCLLFRRAIGTAPDTSPIFHLP